MSAKATGLIWEADLPRPEKYVLLALADHAKEDGTDVYPSLAKVEWKTGYSETQVRGIMRSLQEKRILVLVQKGGKGPRDTDKYRIDYKAVTMLPDFRQWAAEKKGAKTEPITNDKGTDSEPLKGAVSGPQGCGFQGQKGAETEPEPKTTRTVSTEQDLGTAASALPLPIDLPPITLEPIKPEPDMRRPGILAAIRKCWPPGQKCDITPADIGAINRMLANKHSWTSVELEVSILARFMSHNVNPSESVKAWIGAVTDYQSGPQDKYGKPLYTGRHLDEWREQAQVMLYGPQPVQQKIPEPTQAQKVAAFVERVGGNTNSGCAELMHSLKQNFMRKLGRHAYDTWFKPLQAICLTADGTLYIVAPVAEFKHITQLYAADFMAWIQSGDRVREVTLMTQEDFN